MFNHCKKLKIENVLVLHIGDSLIIEGKTLTVFGYTKGYYLAWSEKGGEVFRLI